MLVAFKIHSKMKKSLNMMNSGKIFQTNKVFIAFSLSLLTSCLVLIGRDCLPILHCGRIDYISSKPERRTAHLAFDNVSKIIHTAVYLFL